jgi:uncharacterized protein (TIGR02996 family)
MTSAHEAALLQALAAAPEDELAWQALADVRQEQGDPRGQLLGLSRSPGFVRRVTGGLRRAASPPGWPWGLP